MQEMELQSTPNWQAIHLVFRDTRTAMLLLSVLPMIKSMLIGNWHSYTDMVRKKGDLYGPIVRMGWYRKAHFKLDRIPSYCTMLLSHLIRFALFTFKNALFIYNCLGIPQEKVERGHWTHPNILFGRFPIEIETQIAVL